MKPVITGLALLGALVLAQGTEAQTPNAPANTTRTAPGSMAPGTTATPGTGMGAGTGTGTTSSTTGMNPPGTGVGRATDRAMGTNMTGTNPGGSNAGQNAAGGNTNQAVATTSANAAQPAHGANSFTHGEAQRRIGRGGYQNVSGLKLDNQGVWRGTAMKNGQNVNVWLDYKGNVGQQ